jgi:hypothetical protein
LRRLAWINVLTHLVALLFAVIGMRPGTALAELSDRRAYLATWPPGWTLGWGVWMLCALLLVAFAAAVAHRLPERQPLAGLAALLAGAGAAVDLFCDSIQIAVLPTLAARQDESLFLAVERIAGAGGLVVANGLYALATLLLTFCLRGRAGLGGLVAPSGYGCFLFGMILTAAGFTGDMLLAELSTGPTILLYCVWAVAVARSLEPGRGGS